MIERWHRSLKAAIMCHGEANWVQILPTVMLGLRTQIRTDIDASPAEYVYGTVLRVPGEFVLPDDFEPEPKPFLLEFRQHMRQIKPIPVTHNHKKRPFYFQDLHKCTHVFLRVSRTIKKSLERPYTGPHKVLQRLSERVFFIDVNGIGKTVSVENLKPAYFAPDVLEEATNPIPPLRTYARKTVQFAPQAKKD